MEMIIQRQPDRNGERLQTNRQELVERLAQIVRKDGAVVPFNGLHLFRVSKARNPVHSVSEPSFCVIAQGSKEILLGNSRYVYDPAHYLITTVDLPRTSQILEASPDQPYLSLRRDFDQPLRIEHLAHDLGMSVSGFHHHFKAVTALSPLQFQKQLRL